MPKHTKSLEQQVKQLKIAVIALSALLVLVGGLGFWTYILASSAQSTLQITKPTALDIETDLRSRGIIQGELLKSDEYKPYSAEQMAEFEQYVKDLKSEK